MTLTISADTELRHFEVTTKNQKFAAYPAAFYGRPFGDGERFVCVDIDGRRWFEQLNDIASWVNNVMGSSCLFEIG